MDADHKDDNGDQPKKRHNGSQQPKSSIPKDEYFASLETWDETLQSLFRVLEETGQADNTIIIGSADHGESIKKTKFARVSRLDARILHTGTYMYIPKRLFPSVESRKNLRINVNKTVSILDLFPNYATYFVWWRCHGNCRRAESQYGWKYN
jgi:arylsulfatase A-like enzyme